MSLARANQLIEEWKLLGSREEDLIALIQEVRALVSSDLDPAEHALMTRATVRATGMSPRALRFQ